MKGNEEENEAESSVGPMAVDEFFALPALHRKKVAFYKEMGIERNEDDDL